MAKITVHNKKNAKTLTELAQMYGVSYDTMSRQINEPNLLLTLTENGWVKGNLLWPRHLDIIYLHLGEPITSD